MLFEGSAPAGLYPLPLTQAPEILSNMPPAVSAPRGQVTSEAIYNNSYTADVDVLRSSLLMLKETYVPDWHAYVDGREAPTRMVMPGYVAVQVGPGRHSVRFVYKPGEYRHVLLILGLLALPLIGMAELGGPRVRRAARERGLHWPRMGRVQRRRRDREHRARLERSS